MYYIVKDGRTFESGPDELLPSAEILTAMKKAGYKVKTDNATPPAALPGRGKERHDK